MSSDIRPAISAGTSVAISRIRVDGGTQTRAGIRQEVVDDYAAVLEAGGDLPAAVVFDDGTDLWLADGFHRREAYLLAGRTEMPVVVMTGTKRDALLYSAGCNATHGLRRSNGDKRQAVRMLLADEEWAERSNAWIAEKCKVSDHLVASVRAESTSQTRGCPQKTEENDEKGNPDNGKRVGKDGKKRSARKGQILCKRCKRVGAVKDCPQCAEARAKHQEETPENDLEDGEIVDDEGFTVPAKLREVFAAVEMFRSVEAVLARAANKLKECEETTAYKQADHAQTGEKPDRMAYSTVLFTAAKKINDLRPSLVCAKCGGNGCEACEQKGWLTHGERSNGT